MVLLLTAYALRRRQSIKLNALLNLCGAAALTFSCYYAGAFAAAALNAVWTAIATRDLLSRSPDRN